MSMRASVAGNPVYLTAKWSRAIARVPQYPCTVIEAPIGYGKTTFAIEATARLNEQIIRQKFYEKSPSEFWRGFSSAISMIDREAAGRLQSLGFLEGGLMERELTLLLAELRILRPACVVLDDYHAVRSDSSDAFLQLLIPNMPQNLRLMLATRGRVNWAEELRLKGVVTVVRADELALSEGDIPAYFYTRGIALSSKEVARLYKYTEGWISALYLFALDYQQNGRFAYTASMPELVYHAVYAPLDEEMKNFLLSLSLFDGFSPREASEVWPKDNSAELLTRLMAANTFITRDGETGGYSLHNILNLCVREQFHLLPREEQRVRLSAAGRAMHSAGRCMPALACFEKAEDYDGILRIIQDNTQALGLYPEHKELYIRCYLSCPAEKKARYPLASLAFGMEIITEFHEPGLHERAKADFLAAMEQNSAIDPRERDQLLGEYQLLLGFGLFNDMPAMDRQNAKAAGLLTQPPRFVFTKDSFTFGSPSVLYLYHRKPGDLHKLADHTASTPGNYTKLSGGHGQGFRPMFQAERLYLMGEMEGAESEARRGMEIARAAEQGDIEVCALFLQARLAFFAGNHASVRENLQMISNLAHRLSRDHGACWLLYTNELCAAWFDLSVGDCEGIPDWIVGREYTRHLMHVAISCADIVLTRALLERGEHERLLALSDVLMAQAALYPNTLSEIYIRGGMAAALHKLGHPRKAAEALGQAIAQAEPDGLVMPFVESGAHIAPVLASLSTEAAHAAFIGRVTELAVPYAASVRIARLARRAESGPALTPRERQIGVLAAQGYSNARIAQELYISPNTVKLDMKNLFVKLQISSRVLLKMEMLEK